MFYIYYNLFYYNCNKKTYKFFGNFIYYIKLISFLYKHNSNFFNLLETISKFKFFNLLF
jgi:hypothetical protein